MPIYQTCNIHKICQKHDIIQSCLVQYWSLLSKSIKTEHLVFADYRFIIIHNCRRSRLLLAIWCICNSATRWYTHLLFSMCWSCNEVCLLQVGLNSLGKNLIVIYLTSTAIHCKYILWTKGLVAYIAIYITMHSPKIMHKMESHVFEVSPSIFLIQS